MAGQSEEAWPRPVRASHLASNLAERAPGPVCIGKAVFHHVDADGLSIPLADKPNAGRQLDPWSRWCCTSPIAGQPIQLASDDQGQSTVLSLLQALSEQGAQYRDGYYWWVPIAHRLPALA